MADFMDEEAEVSSGSGSESGSDSDGEKPEKTSKKRAIITDSEDEDGEDLDKDLDDLIDDNPVEDGSGSESGSDNEREKRKHEDSDIDSDLDDEDLDLIKENLGIEVKKKKKLKRIRVMSDDDSDDNKEEDDQDERERVAQQIFEDGDDERESVRERSPTPSRTEEPPQEFDSEEESDPDDFIVDEDGQPISKTKKKKHIIHDDKALQEAQDIFGVDFNFEEFEQYGEEYDEEQEEEDEDYEGEDGEEGAEPRPRKTKKKRRQTKKTIFDVFEPSELERLHFTDADQEVRTADMPERFQLRRIPVCPAEEDELKEEAEWIFKQAFKTRPISTQDDIDNTDRFGSSRNESSIIGKITEALKFMRNQQFEVPFIAFYRKEYVDPELLITDLWQVYQWDEKWMQLSQRKQNMVRLFEKMQQYQFDMIGLDSESTLDASIRALTEEDLSRGKGVQTMEELRDVYQHFLLYYGTDIPKMKAFFKEKRRREAEERGEQDAAEQEDEDETETLKHATRKTGYTMCQNAGLAEIARKFGLTPEQFGENLRDNYQRHEVEQDPAEPNELATEFVNNTFSTEEDVLKGSRHMVAMQIAHEPLVRQCVREAFKERARLTVKPTKKGLKQIDENHTCYIFKYLKNKPIRDLQQDQFLRILQGEEDGILTYDITIDDFDASKEEPSNRLQTYYEEIRQLYHRDEFSGLVQEWNNQRNAAIERALTNILYPQMIKETKNKLADEAKEHVIRASCSKLYNWLKVAPYQPDQQLDEEDEDLIANKVRIMGIAYPTDRDEVAFSAMINGDGEVTDFLRLVHIMKRRNSWKQADREAKEEDMKKVKDFISTRKPHVIAVSAQNREALQVMEDLRMVVNELEQENQMTPINIELVDNELGLVYMNSCKGEQDFREYPHLLRHAISVARRLQDPLIEFCQLCNPDEDILALKYHPLQDAVNKDELLNALYLEFVNRVNEVGVDVNRCVNQSHTAPLIQFVCGLGPRKGYQLLKILKQNNSRLENRTQLVTMCHMGPKVFINCAGFIKIDTTALERESTEAYVEVLDGSRVHPETYEWARKMAVDALEYDDTAEDANPAGALEEILENPERLRDLDLDAFAEELERQGYGNKHITLYDIRAELNQRYKDLRTPYHSPSLEERFNMLIKETPATFYKGKLITSVVTGIAHKKPRGEQLDEAHPVRDDETSLWQCPFCKKNDFPELSEVWSHFDAGECPGQAVGVKTRLENGCSGFIPLKNLSDKHVTNPEERVQISMMLHCRIAKIDVDRFNVELTSKTSDLVDKDGTWKGHKDSYYDYDTEDKDRTKEEEKLKQKSRQTYVKRVIAHPSFHNIDYKTSEKLLANMEQGDVVIRPSSKGSDHLTASWKVSDGVHHHIDVREEGKENAFSLGTSLWIGMEEFEDLDEIIARYIQPMAAFARDITNYKYYCESEGGKRDIMEQVVIEEKRKAPSRIPYFLTASKHQPGKFMLSYMPRKTVRHEFVTVTPDGIRYRSNNFHSLNALVRWFKEHFRDPIPGTPNLRTTPRVGGTPVIGMDGGATARTPAGVFAMPTPGVPGQPFSSFQTPMITPMMTPAPLGGGRPQLMTPGYGHMGSATPQHNRTPQYIPTPKATWGGGTPHSSGGQTPTDGRTPMRSGRTPQMGGRTPQRTPMGPPAGGRTPQRRPGGSTPKPHSGVNKSAMDWAQAAQMWAAKQKQSGDSTPRGQRTPGGRTPGSRTPGSGTPGRRTPGQRTPGQRTPGRHTPGGYTPGDATPLFDEH